MYRRAQIFLVSSALIFGLIAVVTAQIVDKRMLDPEGFLGPSWLRLPLLVGAALLVDLVPRTLWKSKFKWKDMGAIFKERVRTHWTRERLTLVALGIVCFYLVYVCYRNLKSFLPFVVPETYEFDHELHLIDKAVLFGADPAILLHDLLGTGWAAWFLSYIYMWFLPLVPFAVAGWLVWSRNLAYGYWFVSSQCIAWILGTISYYCLPTVGPGLQYPYLYADLPDTPASTLMESLVFTRQHVLFDVDANVVQSVGGFASLHTGITLLVALMIQATINNKIARWAGWINFGITVVATVYFGWHYLADDVAGAMIALVAYYFGGLAAGQKFQRKGVRRLVAESEEIADREAKVAHELT